MRMIVVNAAAAAGIQSIDTPFTDVNDDEGLRLDTALAKQLGFKGKLTINPRHIDIIHQVFSPSPKEVEWALRVIAGLKQAEKEGAGVITVDGKMVDKPIVDRAERVVQLARTLGLVKEELQ
jgi:citrate lyase subunit beta/citryl-CoA lyase